MERLRKSGSELVYCCAKQHSEPGSKPHGKRGPKVEEITLTPLATTHQAFSTPHARTGLEIHGTLGSLHGVGVVHQAPGGTLSIKTADGETDLPLDGHNLYERCLQEFHKAVRGEANDLAKGTSGLQSLAVALAVLESARTGRTAAVRQV